jgi:hypothetical protein
MIIKPSNPDDTQKHGYVPVNPPIVDITQKPQEETGGNNDSNKNQNK